MSLRPEHPDTLISMGQLALIYENQGRWTEAEKLFVQVMETEKTIVLGPKHPNESLESLAGWRSKLMSHDIASSNQDLSPIDTAQKKVDSAFY